MHALALASNHTDTEKFRIVVKTFVISQSSYNCPHIRTLHDRSVNKKINKIHERALRIAQKDSRSILDDLLKKAKLVSIHQRNLQLLAKGSFKTLSDLNTSFMKQIFVEKYVPYNLRSGKTILAPKPKTKWYGIENARFLESRIWHAMPSTIKESHTLVSFRGKINKLRFWLQL